jgi:hypothetical protein
MVTHFIYDLNYPDRLTTQLLKGEILEGVFKLLFSVSECKLQGILVSAKGHPKLQVIQKI